MYFCVSFVEAGPFTFFQSTYSRTQVTLVQAKIIFTDNVSQYGASNLIFLLLYNFIAFYFLFHRFYYVLTVNEK